MVGVLIKHRSHIEGEISINLNIALVDGSKSSMLLGDMIVGRPLRVPVDGMPGFDTASDASQSLIQHPERRKIGKFRTSISQMLSFHQNHILPPQTLVPGPTILNPP
jgi:hypothetical protein